MSWAAVIVGVGSLAGGYLASQGGSHGSQSTSNTPAARTPEQQRIWNEFTNRYFGPGGAEEMLQRNAKAQATAARPMSISIGGGNAVPFLSGTQRFLTRLGDPYARGELSYLDQLKSLAMGNEDLRYGHGTTTSSASYQPGLMSSLGTGIQAGTAAYDAYNKYNQAQQPVNYNTSSPEFSTDLTPQPDSSYLLDLYNNQ